MNPFFFSSRRRHTRFDCDWSSDVCSSDLLGQPRAGPERGDTSVRLTQGTFSYLPDLTDEEIAAQVRYAVDRGWALAVEYSDDPHPRNVYWEMRSEERRVGKECRAGVAAED